MNDETNATMASETIRLLENRVSVRSYEDRPVPESEIDIFSSIRSQ